MVLRSLTLSLILVTGTASAGEIEVTVRQVRPGAGPVMVALYDSASAYADDHRFAGQQLSAAAPEIRASFRDLPAGRYGVAVFQDLDSDGKLSTNFFGLPTEPFGFAGDPDSSRGKPVFERFAVPVPAAGAVAVTVTLSR